MNYYLFENKCRESDSGMEEVTTDRLSSDSAFGYISVPLFLLYPSYCVFCLFLSKNRVVVCDNLLNCFILVFRSVNLCIRLIFMYYIIYCICDLL